MYFSIFFLVFVAFLLEVEHEATKVAAIYLENDESTRK